MLQRFTGILRASQCFLSMHRLPTMGWLYLLVYFFSRSSRKSLKGGVKAIV